MSTRLSILLPAHKASKTIGLAVLSTLAFKPRRSELLIFLDGQNTASKILTWASARSDVRIYSSKTTIGISGALNSLLTHSRSEIIARMDADDVSLPGRFRKGMKLVSSGSEDFVFTNTILFGKQVRPFGFLPHLPLGVDNKQSKWLLWLGNPFAHPTMIARKSAIISLGGYRNSISEDYDLWLRAVAAGFKFRRLKRHGILYRIHSGQLTQQENFDSKNTYDPLLLESREKLRLLLSDGHNDLDDEVITGKARQQLANSGIVHVIQKKLLNWRLKNQNSKSASPLK